MTENADFHLTLSGSFDVINSVSFSAWRVTMIFVSHHNFFLIADAMSIYRVAVSGRRAIDQP
jgi:hypothetical protein